MGKGTPPRQPDMPTPPGDAPATTRDFCLQADALTEAANELGKLNYTLTTTPNPTRFIQTWLLSRAANKIAEAARTYNPTPGQHV